MNLRGISISESTGGLFFNGGKIAGATLAARNADILRFNQATIDEEFQAILGTPIYGNDVYPVPPAPLAANFVAVAGGGGDRPTVRVTNTFDATVLPDSYSWNDITILGGTEGYGILAPTADLVLGTPESGKGSVNIFGSIQTATQVISAGGTLYIGPVSQAEVGGKPYTAWASVTTGAYGSGVTAGTSPWIEAATDAEQASVFAQPAGVAGLYADRIVINAEFLNINGTLQSGYDQYTLTLGVSAQAEINAELAKAGTPSRFLLKQTSLDSKYFSVYYVRGANGQAGTIEIADVVVGGGSIDLTGHILNTANGQIKALGGYGQINVVNNTNNNLVVNDLDASQRGAGVVLIKDKSKTVEPKIVSQNRNTSSSLVEAGTVVTATDPRVRYQNISGQTVVNDKNIDFTNTNVWQLYQPPAFYTTLYQMGADGLTVTIDDGNSTQQVSQPTSYALGDNLSYQTANGWRFGWTVGLAQNTTSRSTVVSRSWLGISVGDTSYSGPWQDRKSTRLNSSHT